MISEGANSSILHIFPIDEKRTISPRAILANVW